nr:MAG TPA: hypothetical protein [Caudoviricetes sp.]
MKINFACTLIQCSPSSQEFPAQFTLFFFQYQRVPEFPSFLLEINFQKIAFHYFINKNKHFY